ncbi:MAG: 2,4-dihydroxyhept-2-ene-1,7-dioic acid aldolase [bacterium]|nr:2,4-dihydroxyhept-2-ene-1,7-dioic acid aldolase [bacterium]
MPTLRDKIDTGKPTVGSWIQLGDEALTEMLATGGFDWLCIDLEHTTISIDQAGKIIRVADLAGCPTLVRLSSHDPAQIKRVLDAGATGIIAPMVNTAEQAAHIVSASTYPPRGSRGVGLARAQQYGVGFPEYLKRMERDLVCIMQVEHIDGVDNLDEILAVEGVDGFFIGPYDLSASLGHPGSFDHPDVVAAMERVANVVKRPGVLAGVHVVEPDPSRLQEMIDAGYGFIAYASDMLFFAHHLESVGADIKRVRGGLA